MASSSSESSLNSELYFLIAKFLEGGPCSRAAQALVEEIEGNGILPKSVNWLGESAPQDFKTFSSKLRHIGPGYLVNLLEQFDRRQNDWTGSSRIQIKRSLLSAQLQPSSGAQSRERSIGFGHSRFQVHAFNPLLHNNLGKRFYGRELYSVDLSRNYIQPNFYSRFKLANRSLGHLTAVYCVLFDVTGNYIFTGADDHLVKIWSAKDGRLLATLRGNSAEITDLAVNRENTLLASSSCDRYIRIWCLATGAPLAILTGHTSNVTSIFFCPMPRSRSTVRYLASTSTDGSCAFWAYTEEPRKKAVFQPKATIYQERMRPGHAQMICSSFSPGGIFMAAGSADNNVRVYHMLDAEGPKRVLEVECHAERVDSISWAHRGVRFISGSKDGTALVWRFEYSQWKYIRISCSKPATGDPPDGTLDPRLKLRVTMVAWNADDSLVLTAISNFLVKVWNPENGSLVRVLRDHSDETFVIEPHPLNPRVVCTAGHDGKIIIWDIGLLSDPNTESGKMVFEYMNALEEGQGQGAVFDTKWSSDGLSLAATDSHGHILIFNATENQKFGRLPRELFFHTDYRPLTTDAITNSVLDEQTQVLPHLMPPPFLVNMDGNPYSPELQRLVPGREDCKDEQLVPNVAVAPGGQAEVIEGIPINARSNIDQMIAQLAAQQGVPVENPEDEGNIPIDHRGMARRSGGPPVHPEEGSRPNDLRGVAFRRSGDVEGVRQSRGNWQTTGSTGLRNRVIVPPISRALLVRSEEVRHGHGDEEEGHFQEHRVKSPPAHSRLDTNVTEICPTDSVTNRQIKSRRLRRLAAQAAERRREEEEQRAAEAEGVPIPNPPQQEISMPQRVPPRRQIRTPTAAPRRRRLVLPRRDSEPENGHSSASSESSFSSSDVSGPSSSESEFSDSDWGDGPVSGTPKKTVPPPSAPNGGKKRGPNRNLSDAFTGARPNDSDNNSDEDYRDPRPGPSSQITKPMKQEPKARPRRAQQKAVVDENALDEIPPIYRPSEWLSSQVPKKFPYFPQLGDELVYFRQGHQMYIEQVKTEKIYEMSRKFIKSLPWNVNPNLEAQVPVRVVGIKFELKPPRLVSLKVEVTEWESGEPTGQKINNVVYHDVTNVVDFLILRQLYNKSLHNWNVRDRFRCLIDDKWWLGTIKNVQPLHPDFPDSKFLTYKISWDNENVELLSPWDIEVIPDAFDSPEGAKDDGIQASEEDQRSGLYEVSPQDWPPYGHHDAECDRIARLIGEVMNLSIAEPFLTPVDLNAYPEYAYNIEYPVDLSTVKARLENRFYRRLDALKFDLKYIALNTETFNQPRTEIVKKVRIIRDLCIRLSTDPLCQSDRRVTAEYHHLSKNFQWDSSDVGVEGRRVNKGSSREAVRQEPEPGPSSAMARSSSRLKQKENGKPRRRRGGESDESSRPWHERCKELLMKMWNCRDATPFKEPVDIVRYPEYYQQIDTPMDLQSIKEDLLGGNYASPLEFSKDALLIFANSKQFNTDKHSPIHLMTLRLKALFECHIRPIIEDWKHSKKSKSGGRRAKGSGGSPSKARRTSSRTTSWSERLSLESPRKNPQRTAASRNPYVTHEEEVEWSEEEEEEELEADEEEYHDKRRRKRRSTHTHSPPPRRSGKKRKPGPSNGHRSSSSPVHHPQPGPSRPSKRNRIESDEEEEEGGPKARRTPPQLTPSPSKRTPVPKLKKGKIKYTTRSSIPVIKEEPPSEEEDEFEESDEEAQMPVLKREEEEESEWSEEGSYPRKRSARVASQRQGRAKRLRLDTEEEENSEPPKKSPRKSLASPSRTRRTLRNSPDGVQRSPRKNPQRTAATKNPFVNLKEVQQDDYQPDTSGTEEEESEDEEEEDSDRGKRRGRPPKRRSGGTRRKKGGDEGGRRTRFQGKARTTYEEMDDEEEEISEDDDDD